MLVYFTLKNTKYQIKPFSILFYTTSINEIEARRKNIQEN